MTDGLDEVFGPEDLIGDLLPATVTETARGRGSGHLPEPKVQDLKDPFDRELVVSMVVEGWSAQDAVSGLNVTRDEVYNALRKPMVRAVLHREMVMRLGYTVPKAIAALEGLLTHKSAQVKRRAALDLLEWWERLGSGVKGSNLNTPGSAKSLTVQVNLGSGSD